MSIIDEILVVIDDNPKISREKIYTLIKSQHKQIISSALGRLIAKGWVNKTKKNNLTIYQLSNIGQAQLDDYLKNIRIFEESKDRKKLLIVLFDVPEKNRKLRDDLRNYLQNHGFGRLHSSIWVSYHDLLSNFKKYISNKSIDLYITYFYTEEMGQSEQKKLIKKIYWDWKKINLLYKNYILKARSYLKLSNKSTYQAKNLVLYFSKILAIDPKLPRKQMYNASSIDEAYKYYQKIRPFCYKN